MRRHDRAAIQRAIEGFICYALGPEQDHAGVQLSHQCAMRHVRHPEKSLLPTLSEHDVARRIEAISCELIEVAQAILKLGR